MLGDSSDPTPQPGFAHLKVAICMTQGPEPLSVAVALLLPAVVTTLSSAMSPSGEVMIRDVNPLPARPSRRHHVRSEDQLVRAVVVAAPLFADVLLPLAPALASSVATPRYSRIRMSGPFAA